MAHTTALGVDATRLLRDQRGMGRWVRNVLRALPTARPALRYTFYLARPADAGAVQALLAALHPAYATQATMASVREIAESRAEVLWYPWNWLHTPARHAAMVASIADVAPMLQLDHRWWKVLKRARFRRRFQQTVQQAHRVLTISAFSADELVRHVHADRSRMHVTALGTDDMAQAHDNGAAVRARLGVPDQFFLSVGALDARKNLRTLYAAMRALHAAGVTVPLVQCGPRAATAREPWLRDLGYVADADLATLYREATALVFPSRYEGFGLPVAEAMAVGGRVICANASSLPEVAGEAGLYFPWDDAAALAAQMQRVLQDASLRATMTDAGRVQSARFRWATTAAGTLDAFDAALADRRR
jgi:glycosyltransferase involved in cell wall biosynthesis